MKVSEVYRAPQGEGPCLGVPSVFVRLAICNLKCVWCDTPFTWDTRLGPIAYDQATPAELAKSVEQLNTGHVVFTGGEPMLQSSELMETMNLLGYGYLIEVETAGTVMPTPEMLNRVHQWNVSPKLENSGNPIEKREVPDVLRRFSAMPNAWFKFVIKSSQDLLEVQELQRKYQLVKSHVILMPEGTDSAESLKNSVWVSEAAEGLGYRFTPRLHVLLYGKERGR